MTEPLPGPVAERDRILALDVVRGLAVLGILVMNIVEFGLPMAAYTNPAEAGGSEGLDRWTWYAQQALFDGRMRALFSMLFGAGIVLIHRRMAATGRGDAAADLLLRRCLWLIPFGIAHRFLLQWTGDILYIYGLLGVVAVALRAARPRTQLILGALALLAFVPIELRRHAGAVELRAEAERAATLEAAGDEVPADLAAAQRRWQRRIAPPDPTSHDEELAAIRGSWVDVGRYRWDHNHRFQHAFVYHYFVWDVLGMMLVGMALGGLGFFAGRMRAGAYVAFAVAGAGATAASFVLAQRQAATGWTGVDIDDAMWRGMLYPFLRGIGGLGWAALLLLALRANAARLVTTQLANVGRMAFSNYVLQTVLCTALFFGWGLGCYGEWSRSALMLVVLAVSAAQIAFSTLWLRRFRFGPLEWSWRSLVYWRLQPMRRAADAPRDVTPTG